MSRNVGISQDEILERTFKNPTLSITDIVNQINKENEEARERALMDESDYYTMRVDNSNLFTSPIITPGMAPGTTPGNIVSAIPTTVPITMPITIPTTTVPTITIPTTTTTVGDGGGGGGETSASITPTTPTITTAGSSSSFKLTDPTLGYKKAIVKYAAPRQPAAVKKQLPNPVTPNLKMVSGNTLSELGDFFKKLWGWY